MKLLIALLAGSLFGFGLSLSGMTDPLRVIGFLDLGGRWDPTLAFVMGGGLLITIPAFAFARRRVAPWFESKFFLPTRTDIDGRLVLGAACFGIGWGIAGFWSGPGRRFAVVRHAADPAVLRRHGRRHGLLESADAPPGLINLPRTRT